MVFMYIPKRYGHSKIENCPFCGKQVATKNAQGVPVCIEHKNKNLDNLKCACGSWLDVKSGKFGVYFNCINCGNINFKKAMEMNEQVHNKNNCSESKSSQSKVFGDKGSENKGSGNKGSGRREITVTSDQLDYLY